MRTVFSGLAALLIGFSLSCTSAGAAVPAEKEMAAYLMVYFSDSDHSLHMALSSEGEA